MRRSFKVQVERPLPSVPLPVELDLVLTVDARSGSDAAELLVVSDGDWTDVAVVPELAVASLTAAGFGPD